MSWQSCPVQAHPSKMNCQADLSRLTCPGWPVRVALSQMSYANWPAMVVPSPCPVLAVRVSLSCSSNLALCFLPRCTIWTVFCPSCLFLAVLYWLSRPGCPVPAVCVPALLPSNLVHGSPDAAILAFLSYPGLSSLFCPCSPVQAVLSG
jgi:hypothetical protein